MTVGRSTPVVVGVIGAGKISEQYLANMLTYPDLDVRVIADLLPERAKQVAADFDIAAAATVEQALTHGDIELIVNLTVPAAHADVASVALAAGKHVWNEKPLTLERASAETLIEAAEVAGLLVGCAPDTFLGPGWQTTLRMIARGDIGQPLTASVVMQYPGPHTWHPNPDFLFQTGAGPLFDMGPYYLTSLTQVFGSITRVAARGASAGPTRTIERGQRAGEVIDVEVPTYVTAIYDFESGAVAAGTFSFDSPLVRVGVVEIAGTEATLAAPDPNLFGGDISIIKTGATDWETILAPDNGAGRGIGVVDMARAIRSGAQHRATGRLGWHVLDAMQASAESIATHEFVAVASRVPTIAQLPEGWDPTVPTL